MEVFTKVLIKLVHTALLKKKDTKIMLDRYLQKYRAAPHRTTGKFSYELMFGRKMQTKLPQMGRRKDNKVDAEAR